MRSPNVLVTAASRRVPLVQAFQSAAASLTPRPGRVIVTDVNPLSPAVHTADAWYMVPLSTDPGYIDTLLAICRTERIGLLVPTIDDELALLGRARDAFAAFGVMIAVSPEETSQICNDKYALSLHLRAHGIPAAKTLLPRRLPKSPRFPLFVKPRVGRGGVDAYRIRAKRDLKFFLGYVPNPIVQEYLDGPEFTIDVLCDMQGRPISIVPRERVVIRAGVIDRGRTVCDQSLIDLARSVTEVLTFFGPMNIQCRVVHGRPLIFEINPRFSGGIPLTIASGADFPRWLLQLAQGRRVAPSIGRFRDQLWMTNYEASIFLDAARPARHPVPIGIGDVA